MAWMPHGGRKLTLMACFLVISPKVGGFSKSRGSNLELYESVDNPEEADVCCILLSDSLLWTV